MHPFPLGSLLGCSPLEPSEVNGFRDYRPFVAISYPQLGRFPSIGIIWRSSSATKNTYPMDMTVRIMILE